jgi:hypothetical protein
LANLDEALLREEDHGGEIDIGDVCNDYCVTGFSTEGSYLLDKIATNAPLMVQRGYTYGNFNGAINPVSRTRRMARHSLFQGIPGAVRSKIRIPN